MPKMWQNCVKIHQGCGGVCRWVEAVDTPGVGHFGECTACGEERIVVEDMLPLEGFDEDDVRDADLDALGELEWDDDADWDANQERLGEAAPVDRSEDNSFDRRRVRERREQNAALALYQGGDPTDAE